MNEAFVAVIASMITGLCSLAGVYIANKKSQALIAYRIPARGKDDRVRA